MKKLLALSLVVFAGACTDSDPGICYTSGEFLKSQVSRDYAELICRDWTNLFVNNCIEMNDLAFEQYSSQADIAAFCAREVQQGEDYYTFRLYHSCNFIDNPDWECTPFAFEQMETPMTQSKLQTMLSDTSTMDMTNLEFIDGRVSVMHDEGPAVTKVAEFGKIVK